MPASKEKFKTLKNVFDDFTERNIFKLISEGHFDGLESPLFIGKEANIFTAKKGSHTVIVKIYRLSTCDFKRMYKYICSDPRFPAVKRQRRKVIFAWAHREYRNLLKAREAGVRVPTPIASLYNILVMEYIGNSGPAPKLKDALPENPKAFFNEVITNIKKLHKAGLVHADLSPFNILNHEEKPVFIDLSQAIPTEDPNAKEYLQRDIHNICNFFHKLKVKSDPEEIFKKITANR
ncbi:MAG: serine protein kinase RIO [Candidatus Woesearchaeota archaeon]